MSIRLITKAWDLPIPTGQKMVLIALADRANDDGECWPGQADIASKCSMSSRSVVNHINWLEDHGLLTIDRRQKGGSRLSNRYFLTLNEYDEAGYSAKSQCANSAHANSAHADSALSNVQITTSQCADSALSFNEEPSLNHHSEPSLLPATSDDVSGRRKSTSSKPSANPLNGDTWDAYAKAFFVRYETEPVRNAKTNGQIANLVKRLGVEAPHVAAWYLGHQKGWYVENSHSLDGLVKDAESLRTQWATNRQVTSSQARSADRMGSASRLFDNIPYDPEAAF